MSLFSAFTSPPFFFIILFFIFILLSQKSLQMIRHLFIVLLATLCVSTAMFQALCELGVLLYFNLHASSLGCWVLFISSILQIKLRYRDYLVCSRFCS